jgi:Fe-S cluster biogenesis protein NfuA
MTTELPIYIEPTPNPTAFKFILTQDVKRGGKVGFKSQTECGEVPLAHELFDVEGVKDIHFFENVITITFSGYAKLSETIEKVKSIIRAKLPEHNPEFKSGPDENERRAALTPDLQKIEAILDETIRPGLRGDGGDLEVLTLDGNQLFVRYQGACGSCPSSTTGTLQAIEGILRDRYDPHIEVITI